ncbi:STAS-like domain-containing protein [Methanobacterium alcaliphilum]|uniref:STAS-like domain-containing protein n=1 Tax=Methanobacterium alcaliphilum TaxID=392018 RepID=UPI00200A3E2D|nr:DUF4325 domain-containing protein [Methanobacterium alcaliphilum]MCK9150479.1 DUF4325 domain-containing protein [Methanobacterium alcaliphilum]
MQIKKDKIHVNIAEVVSPVLGIRLSATQFFEKFESNKKEVEIDFRDVKFISRSFAHEYLKQKQSISPDINELNVPKNVKEMLEIVQRSK